MATTEPSSTSATLRSGFTFFSRVVSIGFIVIGALSLPQAWKLTKSEYVQDGNTIYMPLEICEPESVNFDGKEISFDVDDVGKCRTLDNIIAACISGIFFAMVAMVVFFAFETLARFKIGPVSRSSVLGMSMFMTFILVQAAVCCWALYSEAKYWTGLYERTLDAAGRGEINVQTHGNVIYLGIAFIMAVCSGGLLLIDTLLNFCCAPQAQIKVETPRMSFDDPNSNNNMSAGQQGIQLTESDIHKSEPMQPDSSGTGPAWTNV